LELTCPVDEEPPVMLNHSPAICPTPLDERRTSLREAGDLLDVLLVVAGDTPDVRLAQLEDYSEQGMRLWVRDPLPDGVVLRVGFSDAASPDAWGATHWFPVRTVYCRQGVLGWHLGCEFAPEAVAEAEPAEELLEAILS
jgi:hypothetical protein